MYIERRKKYEDKDRYSDLLVVLHVVTNFT